MQGGWLLTATYVTLVEIGNRAVPEGCQTPARQVLRSLTGLRLRAGVLQLLTIAVAQKFLKIDLPSGSPNQVLPLLLCGL
ncbi:hypothetical protein EDC63_101640 [Sulfurirhabdus autotrophica]|uniref:Uncharacterized protein n=1 Tax=Sulfurirhabdus autotrophica TaxID=1706046 RepID=A0A4R3YEX6_9PROT|nr:hypothetical protein EDC63_101640 [Sulfurirhabdus autotrophica]